MEILCSKFNSRNQGHINDVESSLWYDMMYACHINIFQLLADDKDILIQIFESIRTKGKHFKYKNDF